VRPEISPSGQESFIEAARRGQIVDAAIEVIAAVGYAHASLARIAEHAGISKGVISYHFTDKDHLIRQVVEHILAAFGAYMAPRVQAERQSAAAMLRAYIESHIGFMREHRQHILALVDILSNPRPKNGKCAVNPKPDAGVVALEQIFRRGQRAGEFRRFPTRVMAVTIRGALDAIAPQMIANPGIDLDAYSRELVTIFELAARTH
jgi:AcrR family transcriptional regulator